MTQATEPNAASGFFAEFPQLKSPIVSISVTCVMAFLLYVFRGHIDTVLKLMLSVFIGAVTGLTVEWRSFRSNAISDLQKLRELIAEENKQANGLLCTENVKTNAKLHRELVRTNAVIADRNDKLSVTARILSDFVDEKYYQDPNIDSTLASSIDVVREFAYQNLLFTPRYLEYLFYRRAHSKRGASRIVIIEEACQATLSYLFLSVKAGYDTYVMENKRFLAFVDLQGQTEVKKALKGNPYVIKVDQAPKAIFMGKFMDFRANVSEVMNDENLWNALMTMQANAHKVEANSLYQLSDLTAILNANAQKHLQT